MESRHEQTLLLKALLLGPETPCAIGVHGAPSTGKSYILSKLLDPAITSWVRCDECPTARVVLQRALRQILTKTGTGGPEHAVCENMEAFSDVLASHWEDAAFSDQHFLVLDRIDQLPEERTNIYSCMTRLPELRGPRLGQLCVILVYSTPEPRALLTAALPHVWFPRYTVDEACEILATMCDKLCPLGTAIAPNSRWTDFQTEFLRIVVAALGPYAGTDVVLLQRCARKIWPQFIEGTDLTSDEPPNFPKQYASKSHLFTDENAFVDRLDAPDDVAMGTTACSLVVAAFLASYNAPRYDARFFSHAKDARAKRRETRPRKAVEIPPRSMAPPTFELERLLAIFHALIETSGVRFVPSTQVGAELAQLTAQNLVVRTTRDPLDPRTKWRVNVSESFVRRLAAKIDLPLDDFLMN